MSCSVLYVFGTCSSCGTGSLGSRICGACQRPTLMCDECDATWQDVDAQGPATFLPQPDLPCPFCHASLAQSPAHWASFEELERVGWERRIRDVGRPFATHSLEANSAAFPPDKSPLRRPAAERDNSV